MTVKRYIITADDVVDNLTSTDGSVPLSAKQGKVLADRTGNATTSAKGIMQVGSGLSVSNGVVSASIPNATTSSKGIVQVGSGLSVSNGVISVSGGSTINIPNVSATNNSGFKIGEVTLTANSMSYASLYAKPAGNWVSIKTHSAIGTTSKSYCSPFTSTSSAGANVTIPITISTTAWDSTIKETVTGKFRAVKNNTSTVISNELSLSMYCRDGSASGTLNVTLPGDWIYGTDYINFQVYSMGLNTSFTTSITYAGGISRGNLFYNPVVS